MPTEQDVRLCGIKNGIGRAAHDSSSFLNNLVTTSTQFSASCTRRSVVWALEVTRVFQHAKAVQRDKLRPCLYL